MSKQKISAYLSDTFCHWVAVSFSSIQLAQNFDLISPILLSPSPFLITVDSTIILSIIQIWNTMSSLTMTSLLICSFRPLLYLNDSSCLVSLGQSLLQASPELKVCLGLHFTLVTKIFFFFVLTNIILLVHAVPKVIFSILSYWSTIILSAPFHAQSSIPSLNTGNVSSLLSKLYCLTYTVVSTSYFLSHHLLTFLVGSWCQYPFTKLLATSLYFHSGGQLPHLSKDIFQALAKLLHCPPNFTLKLSLPWV